MTTQSQATATDPANPPIQPGANILEGYTEHGLWSEANNISARTTARYRNQPDGLPWVEFGGKIYIPNDEAAAWLKSRVKRPNKRRAG